MEKNALKLSNLKVGLTVFIGLVIFFTFIFLVGNEGNIFTKTYKLKIFVEGVDGLSDGAMVTLGGLKIGSVDNIEYAKKDDKNGVDITFEVPVKYKPRITESSMVTIKTAGLLGDKFLDVSIGQSTEKPHEEGDYLPVRSQINFDKFSEKAEPALNDFTKLLNNLRKITDTISTGEGSLGKLIYSSQTTDELNKLIGNLNSVASSISNGKGTLGRLTKSDSLYNSLTSVSNNLELISSNISSGKGSLGKLVMEDTFYNDVHSIAGRVDKLLAKTESDTTVIGGLLNDGKMYREVNTLINDLNLLLEDLRAHPERYVKFSVF